ncbi:MAG: prepilin-type N-terminal cleavage/methylation domain-containing protein [Pirellulales bacterium]
MRTQVGYTLLEVLLVLTLLLMLGSIAASSLEGVLERHQLRDVAESVRQHLDRGRLRSAETGLIYQFSAENGGRNFTLAPLDSIDTDASTATQVALQLPSSVRFEQVEIPGLVDPSAASDASQLGVVWCTPILFFPDGTSSGGAIDLVDEENRFARLKVRDLTAACAVSEPQRRPMP